MKNICNEMLNDAYIILLWKNFSISRQLFPNWINGENMEKFTAQSGFQVTHSIQYLLLAPNKFRYFCQPLLQPSFGCITIYNVNVHIKYSRCRFLVFYLFFLYTHVHILVQKDEMSTLRVSCVFPYDFSGIVELGSSCGRLHNKLQFLYPLAFCDCLLILVHKLHCQ